MTAPLLDDGLLATDVAAYLRQHPQFLAGYPELATQLIVPLEHGAVTSLAAYQLHALREKNAVLEQRLAELVTIAADNEALMQRVHELNVSVLKADSPASAARGVIEKLAADFHTGPVRLLSFDTTLPLAPWLRLEGGGQAALPEFAQVFEHHEPVVGRFSPDRLARLFGAEANAVCSAALMPLGELGLLAIGSPDPDHFQPGMGTLFLKMIGATVTAALQRPSTAR